MVWVGSAGIDEHKISEKIYHIDLRAVSMEEPLIPIADDTQKERSIRAQLIIGR